MGERSIKTLLHSINNEAPTTGHTVMDVQLVVRESTGAVRH